MTRLATPIFDHAQSKNFDQPLTVINLHEHVKNQFIPFVNSSDTVDFRVPSHDWPHPFLTTPTPKFSMFF